VLQAHANPFPAPTPSAPPRSLCTVLYGSRLAVATGVWSARLRNPWTAKRVSRNGHGFHENSSLSSQRGRSVPRERWLRCSDTVRGFRPAQVPLWVPHNGEVSSPCGEPRPGPYPPYSPECVEGEFLRTSLRDSPKFASVVVPWHRWLWSPDRCARISGACTLPPVHTPGRLRHLWPLRPTHERRSKGR
jgi:hypothetical protein